MEKQKIKKTPLKIIISLFVVLGFIISLLPIKTSNLWYKTFSLFGLNDISSVSDSSPFSVHILEVGKADSIFVECGGKYMLVDGGTVDCGEKIYEYLYRKGIKKLDYVVNTHPDKDHIGGLAYILKNLEVEKYFSSCYIGNAAVKSKEYIEVQKILQEKDIINDKVMCGSSFNLKNADIRVVGPVRQGKNENNNSIVLKITFGNTRFLLMGDAEKEEETDIINSGADISSDFIKIGHHGSSTSTSDDFLNTVKPRYAAISVTDDTSHLPKKDILKKLLSKNIKTYRTDVDGTIVLMSNGKEISIVSRR